MKTKTGIFTLVLVCMFVGAGVLFAAGAKEAAQPQASALSEIGFHATGFPIVDTPVTVSVMARQYSPIKDFINNDFTKWYEQKTNVHLDWNLVPDSDIATKVSVVLASGDYPDFFMAPWAISLTQQMVYGSQGVFRPLNDYIEKYGTNWKKMMQQYPLAQKIITMPDGKIYSMPNVDDFWEGQYPHKLWIWQPWLDRLGLKVPTTTDELYNVLLAFKNNDPNGNGKADEIPFSGNLTSGQSTVVPFVMNAFLYAGGDNTNYMFVKNGKVDVAYDKPEWREGLRYLHKLYAAGLIAPEAFTQDANAFRKANATTTTVGVFQDLAPWRGFPELYSNDRWKSYTPVAPLKGPNGFQTATYNPYGIGWWDGLIITDKAKYPEVIFRWGDGMYEQETTLRKYYGRPDQEWRYALPGELGINGKPAIWASLAKSGGEVDVPTEHSWMHVGPHFRSADFRHGQVVPGGDPSNNPQGALYLYTEKTGPAFAPDAKTILPPLVFTDQQSSEIGDLQKTINDYVNEMIARFVTGSLNIETDWNNYLTQLDRMNLTRYLAINQQAYDAKYANQ